MPNLPAGLAAAGLAALAATAVLAAPSGAAPGPGRSGHGGHASAATARTVVRPVDAAGQAARGFRVVRESDLVLDCSYAQPSLGSVSPGVQTCSPSAAYAIACWKSATAGRALCTRDPESRRVYSIRYDGRFATTGLAPRRQRSPLVLVLSDGTHCAIRDGGAWGTLHSHPNWFGSYSCTRHGVVWSAPHAAHFGVDEGSSSWTVQTGRADGRGKLTTRHVRRAFFVGTAG